MRQTNSTTAESDASLLPLPLPAPILDLTQQLEAAGIACAAQGDVVLAHLRPRTEISPPTADQQVPVPDATTTLLCASTPAAVQAALPRAVATASEGRRWTQSTSAGPVDLIPLGDAPIEGLLTRFGLSPLCFAYRPATDEWIDPADRVTPFRGGHLSLVPSRAGNGVPINPFEIAPRRFWIAARMIAEHELVPDESLLRDARAGFSAAAERLPSGAPARREMDRILRAARPRPALAFLRDAGVGPYLVPGTVPENEGRIERLPNLLSLRWAAWLRGSATASAMVRFRVHHDRGKRIEKLQAAHPIERSISDGREVGLRKILQRHTSEEVEALFTWRRVELEDMLNRDEARAVAEKLDDVRARIADIRESEDRLGQVKALALDGREVMETLAAGPGRHVGRALAHLAHFVAEDPQRNQRDGLLAELRRWARETTNLLD